MMEKENFILKIKDKLIEGLKENNELSNPQDELLCDDQIGNFFIVKKAIKESMDDDLIQETNIFELAEMIANGSLNKDSIYGIYKMENRARRAAQQGLKGRDKNLKETIKQGSDLTKQLNQKMEEIKSEIQSLTQKGINDPMLRDSISSNLNKLYKELDKKENLLKRLQSSLIKEKPSKNKKDE